MAKKKAGSKSETKQLRPELCKEIPFEKAFGEEALKEPEPEEGATKEEENNRLSEQGAERPETSLPEETSFVKAAENAGESAAERTAERPSEQKEITAPFPEEKRAYIKKRRIVSIVSLIVFIGLFAWLTFAVGKPLVEMASDPEKFREMINAQGFWGRLTFIGIQFLQVVIAMIPGEVIEVGAGYAFGAVEGLLLCLVGVAIGSALIFLLTKRFGLKMVEAFISREKISELKFINNEKRLDFLIFILFFIPGTPKDVLTYFVGLTPMKLGTFLWISLLARIPSVVSSTIGGSALGAQNYTAAIIVFAVTAALSGAGLLVYNRIMKRRQAKEAEKEAPEPADREASGELFFAEALPAQEETAEPASHKLR